jgi:hypothetical protein
VGSQILRKLSGKFPWGRIFEEVSATKSGWGSKRRVLSVCRFIDTGVSLVLHSKISTITLRKALSSIDVSLEMFPNRIGQSNDFKGVLLHFLRTKLPDPQTQEQCFNEGILFTLLNFYSVILYF